jgi:ATP-dependent exoDNAse (exonuclease V) alpha subunit
LDPVTGTVCRGAGEDARLRPGDLLLVDEAGMLDQDTASALLTIADETDARVALVGDRHQLPAVGRGGVLDLAYRWVHPEARIGLDGVHRFVHTVDGHTVPDSDYATQLAMQRDDPGAVFDALHAGWPHRHPAARSKGTTRSPTTSRGPARRRHRDGGGHLRDTPPRSTRRSGPAGRRRRGG